MPRDMQRGILPNTVAPAETWIDALDASDTKVETKARRKGADKPDKDDWTFGIPMKVGKAWQVRWNPRSATYSVAEVSSVPLAAGGYPESVTKGKRSQEVVGGKFLLDHISGA